MSTARIEIDSRVERVAQVQRILGEVLTARGVGEPARERYELAVGEAVANAIVHGNRSRPELPVIVDIGFEGDVLVVDVTDTGDGFDPASLGDPRDAGRLFAPHGRGVHIMRAMMDDVRCAPARHAGSVVSLRASLAAQVNDQR